MKKTRVLFKAFLFGYIIFCMILAHGKIGNEIRESLKLWAGVLIPSIFPYLVLAQYVTSSDALEVFHPFKKFVHKLFNISESGANVYLCSFLSGYPSGAVCASQLHTNHIIKKEEAERLVCFTNNAGPLFVISVVGTSMLGSTGDGVALYVIQSISAMMVGIYLGKKAEKIPYFCKPYKSKGMSLDKCSQSAINTMLAIGAFLVMASVVAQISVFSFEMLPVYGKKLSPYAKAVIYSILEISNATKFLSDFGNTRLIFSLISSVLSWSGLCVLMQIRSAMPYEFSIIKVVRCKMWQSVISFCLAFGYKSVFDLDMSFQLDKVFMASVAASVIIFVLFLIKTKSLLQIRYKK